MNKTPLEQAGKGDSTCDGAAGSIANGNITLFPLGRRTHETPTPLRDALRRLIFEDGHEIRNGKVMCLNASHHDRHPSQHVYDDDRGGHAYCFACGHRVDAVDYLVRYRGSTTRDALRVLGLSTNQRVFPASKRIPVARRSARATLCDSRSVSAAVLERLERRVEATSRIPAALIGRGFTVGDIRRLSLGEGAGGSGIFPILGPRGELLNVKVRQANVSSGSRYVYEIRGNGSPAWCSPGILDATEVLVIEGELNGMAAWLARPDLGVMGVAGTSGCLHYEPLKNRAIYVYADGDTPGQKARERWARTGVAAGATDVYVVSPWSDGDACDVAGQLGRDDLRWRLS